MSVNKNVMVPVGRVLMLRWTIPFAGGAGRDVRPAKRLNTLMIPCVPY